MRSFFLFLRIFFDMCSSVDLTYSLHTCCCCYNKCYEHNKQTTKTDDNYIYDAYMLSSLSCTFLGYQKPRMAFLQEEDDAELPTNYTLNVVPPIAVNTLSTTEQHEVTK